MRKMIPLILSFLLLASCISPPPAASPVSITPSPPAESPAVSPEPLDPALQPYVPSEEEIEVMLRELRGAFDFFWLTANSEPGSPGYGLIPDRMPAGPNVSSIASVGYGLAAICIGVERGWITREEGEERVLGTFATLRDNAAGLRGFFYHFLDARTGARVWDCELSVIDTAICINGVLLAGQYFGGESLELARELYERVEWDWYVNPDTQQFYMGYYDDGFRGAWDLPSEQFMMYFLGAGSPTHPTPGDLFYRFRRPVGRYGSGPDFHYTYIGALFVFQFSHAWYDLRGSVDDAGVDWYRNSVIAALTNRQFGIDSAGSFGTGPYDWGFTACDTPTGYSGELGAPPSVGVPRNDGTVAAYGAAGSIPFIPRYAIPTLLHQYSIDGLIGDYGLKDSYNLKENWVARDTIGIDKGVAMLMIENYLTGFIWDLMASIPAVQSGMAACGVRPAENGSGLLYTPVLNGGRNVGDTLSVVYEPAGAAGVRSVQWFSSGDAAGADPRLIEGAEGLTYTIRAEDADRFIFAAVTPAGLPGAVSNLTPRILEP
jgi:hypothetical protein